jgi:hypothetical protein
MKTNPCVCSVAFVLITAFRSLAAMAAALLTTPTTSPSPSAVKPLPAIRASENGHYFVKADGTPFYWLGDTAWCIFNHPSPEDVNLYLDDRKAKGFTVIQGCVAVWDYRNRANPDGQLPFVNGDPGSINEAYFKNVDRIIDKAAERGLYMAVLPFWTKNTRTGPAADPDKMKAYCRFLAKRYAGKSVFWVLGGDTAGTSIQPVIDAEAAGLLAGAKDAGIGKIMITYHPTGRQSSSFWFHERPWLDFNAIQSGHFINTTNFRLVAADFAKQPVKPTLDMEPGYENITNNLVRNNPNAPRIQAVDVRRSAYLAVFAGAAGHSYGEGEVYEFFDPGGRRAAPGWSSNLPWKEAMKLPASSQVQYLRYLIESRPMLERIPDESLLVGAPGQRALDRIEAMRGARGDYAFVYLPTGQPKVTVQTGKLAGTTLTGWWYDPRTGRAEKIGDFAKSDTCEFTIPAATLPRGTDDWVLVLDNAARNFAAPGKR